MSAVDQKRVVRSPR